MLHLALCSRIYKMELVGITMHKKKTLRWIHQSKWRPEGWVKIKNGLKKTFVIEACTKERANTKWKLYKLTNVTDFAALLRKAPMICKESVLPEPFIKSHTLNYLIYEH